jgi:ribosomal protein S18 acetylase RimI-like enzyme
MLIRLYQSSDRAAVADVCVRTADAGGDSRHLYPVEELMPSIFALPYAHLEPDLAFVLDDGDRAVGYILGTADTTAFVENYRTDWLPGLLDRYPATETTPRTPTEQMVWLMHHPERMILPELADYPAHLHIDLLPDHQRHGHGKNLMGAFLHALADEGVPAVHLGMLTSNTGARVFYDRLGFHPISVPAHKDLTYLGLKVGPNAWFGTPSQG